MLTKIDILDEPDALRDDGALRDDSPWCERCGEQTYVIDDYGWCEGCRENEDPSPMCNCGTCSPGEYTCIRSD